MEHALFRHRETFGVIEMIESSNDKHVLCVRALLASASQSLPEPCHRNLWSSGILFDSSTKSIRLNLNQFVTKKQ
jgi:hypothetical protein